MNDMTHRPSIEAPQLRTLLLTDLCDSTTLIERIGDVEAATLFRDHDRLVLDLQQRWRGRLIDRSDGMLLLFERPIDGLGFALDYMRGLREMGSARKLELKARAGLHVGEVLTWRNSDEAVQVGAKPLEVEGLAKPMAARLMAMARPGQILLSAVAEPLAHRAARELGERGQHLLWKSHGRWRFKGVPDSQQIYEVGEPGIAPLRMPPHTPKAWRDIPLWRRPAALAAEAAVIAGIGVGVWFATRPAPAIAFNQRDWVVVADLRNLTGDRRYDDSLESALRISLEQSKHVNILSDARVRETLQLMRQAPLAEVDRELASEVALRSGARAVLLPTVSEVGGQVQVSVEVVDPTSQATVYAETARGRGADSAIASVGEVSANLREHLGEALSAIEGSSAPAEKVTTGSLDAMRAFTLGQQAYALQDVDEARQHFKQALSIDDGFALARIGLARIEYSQANVAAAQENMAAALKDKTRLSARERLYADAQMSMLAWDTDFISKWEALYKLYPDFHVAAYNMSYAMLYANRYPEALDYSSRAAAAQAITRPAALHHRAIAEAALGDFAAADRDFSEVDKLGSRMGVVYPVFLKAAQGNFDVARSLLARKIEGAPRRGEVEKAIAGAILEADAGRWDEADRKARDLLKSADASMGPFQWVARSTSLSIMKRTAGKREIGQQVSGLLESAQESLPKAKGLEREIVAMAALYAGFVGSELGYTDAADRAIELAAPIAASSPQRALANMIAIVRAKESLRAGNAQQALDELKSFDQPWSLALTRLVRTQALQELSGTTAPTLDRTDPKWRGRAYMEWAAERPPIVETLAAR
ncbi:putative peptide modification system cyclase [Lysobacter sp.]|uniref:putative peptide modification system cyclase n=1 Tax=Lysobacter sp. TaxID=72226 RepID=UPI002D53EFFD|nr:putative peptide modification system cyclase [Lysobacter sp.]HZX78940.1 putative peptide modification system cyclase [Lysobacter sp.]